MACWLRLEEVVAEAGVPPRRSETSAEFVVRVLHSLDLDPRAIGALAALYREARFSEHELGEDARTAARAALAARCTTTCARAGRCREPGAPTHGRTSPRSAAARWRSGPVVVRIARGAWATSPDAPLLALTVAAVATTLWLYLDVSAAQRGAAVGPRRRPTRSGRRARTRGSRC